MAFYREISHPLKKRNSGEEGRLHLSCVSNGNVDFSSITRVLQLGSGRPMAHFNTRFNTHFSASFKVSNVHFG